MAKIWLCLVLSALLPEVRCELCYRGVVLLLLYFVESMQCREN